MGRITRKQMEEKDLFKILFDLPLKTMLRFRCLSRYHKSTIDDPKFSSLYSNVSIAGDSTSRRLFLQLNPHLDAAESAASAVETIGFCSFSDKTYSGQAAPARKSFLGGSCLGLICVAFSPFDVCLWNPSTRTHRHLVPPNFECDGVHRYVSFGLGTDSDRNVKIVRIVFSFSSETRSFIGEASVYELHTDTWQKINLKMKWPANSFDEKSKEAEGIGWEFEKSGVCVSSNIELVVKHYGSTQNGVGRFTILSLNLNDYKFSKQPIPNHMLEGRSPDSLFDADMWPFNLTASLSLNFSSEYFEAVIWVKEVNNWIKMLSVEGFYWRIKPLCYFSKVIKRIVLLQMDSSLVWYDLQKKMHWDSNALQNDSELYEATVYIDCCDLITPGSVICPQS